MKPTSPVIARRRILIGATGAAALLTQFAAGRAGATPETAKALLQTLAKGEPKEGRISIRAPEIAENGNAVPVTVSVESPMTDKDYVKAVHVFADGNPLPGVVSYRFTPASGKAAASTRMRLAQTQNIIAIAEMSNGDLHSTKSNIKVTIGGCGG